MEKCAMKITVDGRRVQCDADAVTTVIHKNFDGSEVSLPACQSCADKSKE